MLEAVITNRSQKLSFSTNSDLPVNRSLSFNSTKRLIICRLVEIQTISRRQIEYDTKTEICFRRVKNIVGKGENAGYQHFLLFP